MKNKLFFSFIIFFILLITVSKFNSIQAQTAGKLTFTYTQAVSPATATLNVMAVWIESSTGTFIKTKMRYWSSGTNDHLPSWVSKSAQNTTDATTGATLKASTTPTAFGSKTITWNGTNTSSALVADGSYNVWVESAIANPQPSGGQHTFITSFSFTKGSSVSHLTPTSSLSNFTGITLDWVPATPITITTSALSSNTVCVNSTVNVPFTKGATDTIYNNNVWTAQLSDATGSFASPVSIGTLSGIAVGTITATIPAGTVAGSGYRIRVVGSQPACTGTDNGTNITITTAPSAPSVGNITQTTCTVATGSVVLNGLPSTGSWTINPGNISGSGITTTLSGLTIGTHNYTVTSGCTSVASANVVINPQPIPVTPIITLSTNILHSDATTGNQWYDQNGFINGATNQNYTATANGNYFVIVTVNGCSSDSSNIIQYSNVGIKSVENNNSFNIYPNPVSNELIIESDVNNNGIAFEILNSIGQVVYKGRLLDKTVVQTTGFAPGIYILKLENGKSFEFKKIIKE
ncbi:MAG: DUF2271 domain-containing protein [Bacteroidetes bacterium]|nr:DUF2271 domain-containing protein [Bacteroidota bacterium]